MKALFLGGVSAIALVAATAEPVAADGLVSEDAVPGEVSAGVAFTTDYVFRGVSQTDEHAALQANVDWTYGGFYIGAWGANVDFDDGDEATVEVDLYGGYDWSWGPVDMGVGLIYYWYPGADGNLSYDYVEFSGSLGTTFAPEGLAGTEFTVGTEVYGSPEFFGDTGEAVFWRGSAGVALPFGVGVDGGIGHQWIARGTNYLTWDVGASYGVKGLTFDVRYHDTDEGSLGDLGGERVVFSVAHALGEGGADDDSFIPGELSAGVGFATDYVFRGVSQTDEHAAVQANIDWGLAGFYVGAWGSNVDFDDGDEATVEVDIYGGYANSLAGIDYNFGAIYYWYPGADSSLDYNYVEVVGTLGYGFAPDGLGGTELAVGTEVYYSPEFFGDTGDAVFWRGSAGITLPAGIGIDGGVGHQWIDQGTDYLTWDVGVTTAIKGIGIDVRYHDTDEGALGELGEERVVLTASYPF